MMADGPASSQAVRSRTIDPVTFEVLRNAVDSILDEMALTILRTARSTIVRDAMDFATSFFDADGQLLAQGLTLPFHLGGMPDALMAVRHLVGTEVNGGPSWECFHSQRSLSGGQLPSGYLHVPSYFHWRSTCRLHS